MIQCRPIVLPLVTAPTEQVGATTVGKSALLLLKLFFFPDLWRWKTRMPPVHREELVWQERVVEEVEKIRSKNQERRQEDILRAWRGNR